MPGRLTTRRLSDHGSTPQPLNGSSTRLFLNQNGGRKDLCLAGDGGRKDRCLVTEVGRTVVGEGSCKDHSRWPGESPASVSGWAEVLCQLGVRRKSGVSQWSGGSPMSIGGLARVWRQSVVQCKAGGQPVVRRDFVIRRWSGRTLISGGGPTELRRWSRRRSIEEAKVIFPKSKPVGFGSLGGPRSPSRIQVRELIIKSLERAVEIMVQRANLQVQKTKKLLRFHILNRVSDEIRGTPIPAFECLLKLVIEGSGGSASEGRVPSDARPSNLLLVGIEVGGGPLDREVFPEEEELPSEMDLVGELRLGMTRSLSEEVEGSLGTEVEEVLSTGIKRVYRERYANIASNSGNSLRGPKGKGKVKDLDPEGDRGRFIPFRYKIGDIEF
ncbi:hypothetical protein M5K25_024209 [Dendrobium thyrsiflorum]|uniref:Uncharacterized protein n=1 Tax=Dendrobium thyrsiflorum TaxID=117978 RepID=A0ABD0U1D8_DENTH